MFPIEELVVGMVQSQLLKSANKTLIFEAKNMKIAIIGKGHVGSALGSGLSKAGHDTKFGHRDPKEPVADAAKWGEVIILAVPHENADDAREAIKPYVDGKVVIDVIDVMNAVGENAELAISCTTSTAEETQKKLPKAKVVKAFNTVFASNRVPAKLMVNS